MKIPTEVSKFFLSQGFVIVATLDDNGQIHGSAKGLVIIENINDKGRALIFDLYMNRTFRNLQKNTAISVMAIDERAFEGYVLQGTAKMILSEDVQPKLLDEWESRLVARISHRVISSVQRGKKSSIHPEIHLPKRPKYLIEMAVKNIINLSTPSIFKNNDTVFKDKS
jgi:putative heme iron utilization protein